MSTYKGNVIDNTDEDFPFLAIIHDTKTGDVVAEFPVRTKADGEAKIDEALRELKRDEAGPTAA